MEDNNTWIIERYKDKIIVGRKSLVELLKYIEKLTLIEVTPQDIGDVTFRCAQSNVLHAYQSKDCLQAEQMEYRIYFVVRDEKSVTYYKKYDAQNQRHGKDNIYILFEKNTVYIDSNCNDLLLELLIARGVSLYDIENTTPELIGYLTYFLLADPERPCPYS